MWVGGRSIEDCGGVMQSYVELLSAFTQLLLSLVSHSPHNYCRICPFMAYIYCLNCERKKSHWSSCVNILFFLYLYTLLIRFYQYASVTLLLSWLMHFSPLTFPDCEHRLENPWGYKLYFSSSFSTLQDLRLWTYHVSAKKRLSNSFLCARCPLRLDSLIIYQLGWSALSVVNLSIACTLSFWVYIGKSV